MKKYTGQLCQFKEIFETENFCTKIRHGKHALCSKHLAEVLIIENQKKDTKIVELKKQLENIQKSNK